MNDFIAGSTSSCLCGCVTIKVNKINPRITVCHCDMCRKWGGGPAFALHCGTEVDISGADKVHVYDSSEWAERGFCVSCGTHLFYRIKGTGDYSVPAGFFPDLKALEIEVQYFSDSRPDYYCFANKTKELTGAEVFALYAPAEQE
ncbi:GFA family protein [Pseudomonadota bacterium]